MGAPDSRRRVLPLAGVALLLLGGMVGPVALAHLTAPSSPQPPEEEDLLGPADLPPPGPAAAAGERLFLQHCARCHQVGATGKVGMAPRLRGPDLLALVSDDFIRTTVRRGREATAMVPRPDLSDEDVGRIIAYLRSRPAVHSYRLALDAQTEQRGDAARGRHLFATFCAPCHGPGGEGYGGGFNGPGIGQPAFLKSVPDDFILQTLKHGRTGTPMRSFVGPGALADLGEAGARDVIAFLRQKAAPSRRRRRTSSRWRVGR